MTLTLEEKQKFAPIEDIIDDIKSERAFQDIKWGVQAEPSNPLWAAILCEETGEVSKGLLDLLSKPNGHTHRELYEELIQVAAVAVAWAQKLRQKSTEKGYIDGSVTTAT